jgi:hypothetical protein
MYIVVTSLCWLSIGWLSILLFGAERFFRTEVKLKDIE